MPQVAKAICSGYVVRPAACEKIALAHTPGVDNEIVEGGPQSLESHNLQPYLIIHMLTAVIGLEGAVATSMITRDLNYAE